MVGEDVGGVLARVLLGVDDPEARLDVDKGAEVWRTPRSARRHPRPSKIRPAREGEDSPLLEGLQTLNGGAVGEDGVPRSGLHGLGLCGGKPEAGGKSTTSARDPVQNLPLLLRPRRQW